MLRCDISDRRLVSRCFLPMNLHFLKPSVRAYIHVICPQNWNQTPGFCLRRDIYTGGGIINFAERKECLERITRKLEDIVEEDASQISLETEKQNCKSFQIFLSNLESATTVDVCCLCAAFLHQQKESQRRFPITGGGSPGGSVRKATLNHSSCRKRLLQCAPT